MTKEQLPQPTELGSKLGRHAGKIIRAVSEIPFIGTALEVFFEHRKAMAVEIIVSAIGKGQIDLIDDAQYQYLVPNVYAYFEAARSGEHEHNLRILAQILCDGISIPDQAPYAVRSASRRLGGLSSEDLRMLAKCYRSFERCKNDENFQSGEGYYIWTEDKLFAEEIGVNDFETRQIASSYLAEFSSRAFLYADGLPWKMSGFYYYKTKWFDEMMHAARNVKLV